ncbi:MAG: FliM/FliN family flagellar motor switch protein [Vampirovibrionales bacterium]
MTRFLPPDTNHPATALDPTASVVFPEAPVVISQATQRETLQHSAQTLLSSWQPTTGQQATLVPKGKPSKKSRHVAPVVETSFAGGHQGKHHVLHQQCKHVMEATWRILPMLEALMQQYWGQGIRLKPWMVSHLPEGLERLEHCYQSTIILDDTQQRQVHFKMPLALQGKLLASALGEHLHGESTQGKPSSLDAFLIDHCHERCFNALVEARFMDEWFPLALQPEMLHVGFLVLQHTHTQGSQSLQSSHQDASLEADAIEPELLGKWWIQAPLKAFTPHTTGLHAGQTQYPILPLHTSGAWEPITTRVTFSAGSTLSTLREMRQLSPGDLLLLEKSQAPWLQLCQWVQPRNYGYFKQRLGHHFLTKHPVVKTQVRCVVPQLQQYPPHVAAMLKQAVQQDRQAYASVSSLSSFSSLSQSEVLVSPMMSPPSPMSSPAPSTGAMSPQWDDLLIDVQASFDPIQMPLKQLKQVTQGLVLELGELRGKHIRLHVEGNTLAFGELVIIGEQFGVLIHEVAHQPPQGGSATGV